MSILSELNSLNQSKLNPGSVQAMNFLSVTLLLIFTLAGTIFGQHRQSPRASVFRGQDENLVLGYSVRIPKGLRGRSAPPPQPQHGFVIALSQKPGAELSVDASYNALEWNTLSDAFNYYYQELLSKSGDVRILEKRNINWSGRRAIKFTLQYKNKGSRRDRIESSIISFRTCPGESAEIVYAIDLHTSLNRSRKDKALMKQVYTSMKLFPRCAD